MSKPFGASPKGLIEFRPEDWPAFLGVVARRVEVADADVSTVTAAGDKVLRLRCAGGDSIQHFDFQSGPDASLPRPTHCYNGLLEERHELPVDSIVVLLRREANLRAISGVYTRTLPGRKKPYLTFEYQVVRVWQLPVEAVLAAGLSVLPLAPIAAVKKSELPSVIGRMMRRLDTEADPVLAAELWTATKVLMGLCYDAPFIDRLLQGVRAMKESSTYQAIVAEGVTKGECRLLLRQGETKFGSPPPTEVRTRLEAITDTDELERLGKRLLVVDTWADLVAPVELPSSGRSRRKKSS